MNHDWQTAIRRILWLLTASTAVGWGLGDASLGLAVGCLCYLVWHTLQMYRLQAWLYTQNSRIKKNKKEIEPPYSHGLWGLLFDEFYRMQRQQKKAKKRLKAVLQRVQDSTTAMKDGVLMVDHQGCLEWWNPAAQLLLGLQEAQDKGHPITNLLRAPEFISYFDSLQFERPLEIPSPTNSDIRLQIHITLFGNNDRLILCRDITHLHHLEAMRQDFVANASHELRTPLTVISGYLETFIDYQEQVPARWQRGLKQMHQQSLRMENLISDLLTLSRLETSHDQDHHKVVVPEMLASILQDAQTLSGEKQHRFNLETQNINLLGIHNELSSAFSNLIFNAVKYTQAGGEINIRWFQDSRGMHLQVSDNGPGIDSQHLPRLTERFYRADASRHAETGGTGLGLAIVKHILLHHEGHLQIESVVGEGSCFSCHFPMTRVLEGS